MDEHVERLRERLLKERDERERLSTRLAEAFLPNLPPSVTGKVFERAWEDGHSGGEHEVEIHYEEIAVIALAAWEAGRKREIDR